MALHVNPLLVFSLVYGKQ